MGKFIRTYWYKQGIEYANPFYNSRFRVNSPEASLHPDFMYRSEARENGMMQILINEDLNLLDEAKLYLEIWGGHPGTANKRVSINGRSIYSIVEVGTTRNNCTHQYPIIPLKITDLVNGYNAIQFSCDQGNSFWGHFIVDNACLITTLKANHPDLRNIDDFDVSVISEIINNEYIKLGLSSQSDIISKVDYWGYYYGYDENGNLEMKDWHGFTKEKEPSFIIGSIDKHPFEISWNISMLPEQDDMKVMAVVHFKGIENIVYLTSIADLNISKYENKVKIYASKDIPTPFWSRAKNEKRCSINIDVDPKHIKCAELHIVIWDGGRGNIEHPFKINGHPIAIADEGHHDVIYRKLNIKPNFLKKGFNEITLLSDTEHHGIEVLLPGPSLFIKT
jgi:hypothetical protein